MNHDQHSEWTDSIDDWETALTESPDSTSATDEHSTSATNGDTASRTDEDSTSATDGNGTTPIASETEIHRIDPISDPTVEAAADVLPDAWLADPDAQRLIQWVVYVFVEQTNATLSTSVRVKIAIDRVANRTAINPVSLRRVCTTSLYRDRAGSAKRNLHSDLEAIDRRTR